MSGDERQSGSSCPGSVWQRSPVGLVQEEPESRYVRSVDVWSRSEDCFVMKKVF